VNATGSPARGPGGPHPARPRIPASTYRVQFHPDFGFGDAARIAPYLDRLGVTDLYVSPCLQARPGSPHGYDITSHGNLSPSLGGDLDWRELSQALSGLRMGLVMDFVPNHMGVDEPQANRWWWDVLENGGCSPYARFFDIDWDPVKPELRGKLLLPLLGDQYGRVLERGELQLDFVNGGLELRYFERKFPIDPRSVPLVLRHGIETLQEQLGESDADLRELLSILTALGNLPTVLETDTARVAERQREKEVARERLDRLAHRSWRIKEHIEGCVRTFNGRPDDPASFQALHRLLEEQAYRLAYWRTAFHEINYRRFFDVNALACVRMEDPEVFESAHGLLLRLIAAGSVSGVRLDHVDGLYDPKAYLRQLSVAVSRELVERSTEPGLDATPQQSSPPVYLVAEKVLSPGERLPDDWVLHGTTGYDFLNEVNGVLVDPQGQAPLRRLFERFTRRRGPFADVVYQSKKVVMRSTLAGELNMLAHALNLISEGDPRSRDFTLNSLHDMLLEVVACFPVYRTYVAEGHREEDARLLRAALARARRKNPGIEASIFEFLRHVMLDLDAQDLSEEDRERRRTFTMKLQQYTGPVQAKGLEDTAFYRHHVLLSLNEVGGAPERFAIGPPEFHAVSQRRREHWPHAMLCTSTHDTKRGEDARARLTVLSEIPDEWRRAVSRWARLNAASRTRVDEDWAPDRGDEYLFYQALVGAWPAKDPDLPALASRLSEYMSKAIREAKLHTSWVNENTAYQQAVEKYVEQVLTGRRSRAFLEALEPFAHRVARLGVVNSLAQLTVKIASPGVPDFYQGTELWDLSFVDPDNRRPVDFAARQALLESLAPSLEASEGAPGRAACVRDLLEHWEDGRIKLWVTASGLRLRRQLASLLLDGNYVPLEAVGERAGHVLAFARVLGGDAVVAVVPRLCARLADGAPPLGPGAWGDTQLRLPTGLAPRAFEDVITGAGVRAELAEEGGVIALAEILRDCPVALLRAQPA
jgi:(1->4)-alpha-D-glucan 1-alpha-D-glucosylmutase